MKLFTNKRWQQSLILITVVSILAACSNNGRRPSEEAKPASASGESTQSQVVIRAFDPAIAAVQPMRIEEFGPDPYTQRGPQVPPQAAQEFGMAIAELKAGNDEQAEQRLMGLVDAYTTLSGPAYNLAALKFKQGDNDAAKKYAELALSRNFFNQHARNLLASLYRDAGDFEAAEKEYKETIKIWGGYVPAFRNLGILYDLYMGRIDEALIYYKQYAALLSEPDHQVQGWIVDIERQLKAKQAQLAREQQAQAAAAQAETAAQAEQAAPADTAAPADAEKE